MCIWFYVHSLEVNVFIEVDTVVDSSKQNLCRSGVQAG